MELIKLLQTQCPLKIVYLRVPDDFDFRSNNGKSRYLTLLEFKNLTSFTLLFDHSLPGDGDLKLLEPLKTIAVNSPMLKDLALNFKYMPVTLEHVISSLGVDFTLPCLEGFHLSGCPDSDSEWGNMRLPRPPGNGAGQFQAFISRHPRLEELEINCPFFPEFRADFDPGVLARGLPELTLFSGPYFLCQHILHSRIAEQICDLTISNWEPELIDPNEDLADERYLPELQRLAIELENIPIAKKILNTVLLAAEGLDNLHTPAMHQQYHEDFLKLLTFTPELQYICLWNYDSYMNADDAPVPSGFNRTELVAAIQNIFPEVVIECLGDWN
ncbi:hypothetical protein RSOLAG22IIIB_09054 [Rhizoctonia solani]|uniref:Uncharacterized protein n=1 Tax=Rhizoctonia solani TaxID=456999 RepID=A0A0K6FXK3_9AGAM|nr:hypothetical protein RSOLAG22IIIB_09054 [Rhizoctonia solani]